MKLFDQVSEPRPKLGDVVQITTEDETTEVESSNHRNLGRYIDEHKVSGAIIVDLDSGNFFD